MEAKDERKKIRETRRGLIAEGDKETDQGERGKEDENLWTRVGEGIPSESMRRRREESVDNSKKTERMAKTQANTSEKGGREGKSVRNRSAKRTIAKTKSDDSDVKEVRERAEKKGVHTGRRRRTARRKKDKRKERTKRARKEERQRHKDPSSNVLVEHVRFRWSACGEKYKAKPRGAKTKRNSFSVLIAFLCVQFSSVLGAHVNHPKYNTHIPGAWRQNQHLLNPQSSWRGTRE